MSPPVAGASRWLSANPDKAWGEKFFLAYSVWWMLAMGVLMQTGAGAVWGDAALNLVMLVILVPAVAVPAWLHRRTDDGRPWPQTYWFKANVWLAIYSGVGSYFGSEYFFDVLGMTYHFPQLDWSLDSVLLGSGQQTVPLIMYPSAHFYFLTYHTLGVIVLRRARTSRRLGRPWMWPLLCVGAAYVFAYMETWAMAGGAIAEQFGYRDLARMLRWGSLFYGIYFVISFPMIYRLEETPGESWPLSRVAIEALAAGMLLLFALDTATRFVGTMY